MTSSDHQRWNVERLRLRDVVAGLDGRLLLAVGVGDGLEARELHHAICDLHDEGAVPDYVGGFVYFVSGYLCAAAQGLPDLGYVLRHDVARATDVVEQATWLAALDRGSPAHPIGVDVDTGYGNEPSAVVLTCRQVHKQGAAYVQIEDQYGINKSCGHMEGARGAGKVVIDAEEMIELRLRPAVAYATVQDDFTVLARTDARASAGLDEALRRARLYVEAGARMIFVEAPESEAELRRVADELREAPALDVANMVEGSTKTPYLPPRRLHEMGFDVALYPVGALLGGHEWRRSYYRSIACGDEAQAAGRKLGGSFERVNRALGRDLMVGWNRLFAAE